MSFDFLVLAAWAALPDPTDASRVRQGSDRTLLFEFGEFLGGVA